MAAIFVLSNQSTIPHLPVGLSNYTGHFIGYGLLGGLALRAFADARWQGVHAGSAWRGIVFASLYGITDEFHQSFVTGRTSTVDDWIADTAGAAVAVLLIVWIARARRRRSVRDV